MEFPPTPITLDTCVERYNRVFHRLIESLYRDLNVEVILKGRAIQALKIKRDQELVRVLGIRGSLPPQRQ